MKRGIILLSLAFLLVTSMLLSSCGSSTTTSTTTTTTTTNTTSSVATTTTAITIPTTGTSTSAAVTASTTSTGNWWDSLGTPTYGGTLVDRIPRTLQPGIPTPARMELRDMPPIWHNCGKITTPADPSIWDFEIGWLPDQYATGLMMTGYEMPNPYTVICHLPNNVYWQNTRAGVCPPVRRF